MRRLLAIVLAVLGMTATLLVVAAPAQADSEAYQFLSRVNSARKSHGLRPLAMKSDLVSVASRWSGKMASSGDLRHNPNLTGEVRNWQSVGENVGVGPDVSSIQQAFMGSSSHRANILDRDFTDAGFATKRDSKGELWVTQVFRQPKGSSAGTTTTAPKRTTTTRPATKPAATTPRRPSVTRPSAPAPRSAPAPAAPIKPVAVAPATLAQRLAGLHAAPAGADPVARAIGYVSTMATLTR